MFALSPSPLASRHVNIVSPSWLFAVSLRRFPTLPSLCVGGSSVYDSLFFLSFCLSVRCLVRSFVYLAMCSIEGVRFDSSVFSFGCSLQLPSSTLVLSNERVSKQATPSFYSSSGSSSSLSPPRCFSSSTSRFAFDEATSNVTTARSERTHQRSHEENIPERSVLPRTNRNSLISRRHGNAGNL